MSIEGKVFLVELIALVIVLLFIKKNILSVGALLITSFCFMWGSNLLVNGVHLFWTSLLLLVSNILLYTGFNGPESTPDDQESKVFQFTFLGKLTKLYTDRLSFFMNFLVDFVGYIPVKMGKVDHDFKFKKPVLTRDGVSLNGIVSVTMIADDEDDEGVVKTPWWRRPFSSIFSLFSLFPRRNKKEMPKTGGEKIIDFINLGGYEKAKEILDDLLTVAVQHFANVLTAEEMEQLSDLISGHVLERVREGSVKGHTDKNIDDIKDFGLRFIKFQVIVEVPEAVRKARERILVERAQRVSDVENARTMNQTILERSELYRRDPEAKAARDDLFEELALNEEALTINKNPGGVNVQTNPGRRGH